MSLDELAAINDIIMILSILVHLLYKAEKPSVCLSVCLSVRLRHADISAVSAQIETGLARNESCVFEDHKVYF